MWGWLFSHFRILTFVCQGRPFLLFRVVRGVCFVCDGPPCVPQAGLELWIDSPFSVGQGAGTTGGTNTTSDSNKTNLKVLKDVRVTVSALRSLNSASHGLEAWNGVQSPVWLVRCSSTWILRGAMLSQSVLSLSELVAKVSPLELCFAWLKKECGMIFCLYKPTNVNNH